MKELKIEFVFTSFIDGIFICFIHCWRKEQSQSVFCHKLLNNNDNLCKILYISLVNFREIKSGKVKIPKWTLSGTPENLF